MLYLDDVVECFLVKEFSKLFCYAIAVDTDDESSDEQGYLVLIKVDRFYETTLDQLPENIRELVKAMIGREGG